MNPFTDIVFVFVFVFCLLHFKLIDLEKPNIVQTKIAMFMYVTVFATILNMMKSIRRQLPIDVWNSAGDGIIIGILAYAGHTMVYDIWYMESTRAMIQDRVDPTYFTINILVALSVSLAITIGKTVKFIFATEPCA